MSEMAQAICIGFVVADDGAFNDSLLPAAANGVELEEGTLMLEAMMDCSQSIRGRSNAISRMNKTRLRESFGFEVAPRRCASLAGADGLSFTMVLWCLS